MKVDLPKPAPWRWKVGGALLIASALLLFGAAEGPQKWQWIIAGLIPDALLTVGFVFL